MHGNGLIEDDGMGGESVKKRKPSLPKWKYAFSCRGCKHVQFIKDEAKRREGNYCVKAIEYADAGLPGPIHADEADRVVRCDCYEPTPIWRSVDRMSQKEPRAKERKPQQLSMF